MWEQGSKSWHRDGNWMIWRHNILTKSHVLRKLVPLIELTLLIFELGVFNVVLLEEPILVENVVPNNRTELHELFNPQEIWRSHINRPEDAIGSIQFLALIWPITEEKIATTYGICMCRLKHNTFHSGIGISALALVCILANTLVYGNISNLLKQDTMFSIFHESNSSIGCSS